MLRGMETTTAESIASLKPGEQARITCLDDACGLCSRLSSLGVLPDSELCVVNVAPLGDPMTIRVDGQQFALRRADACSVLVERTGTK